MEEYGFDVIDAANRRGRLTKGLDLREPETAVRLDDGGEIMVPTDRLVSQPDGGLRLTSRFTDVGREAGAPRVTVIPVLEERLEVGKREVETGRVRVRKRVSEQEQTVDEPLLADEITIERVAINRFVDRAEPARVEGDTTVIPLHEERLVVERRLVLREEVRITKHRVERRAPERVTLRREEVTVERVDVHEK